MAFLMIGLDRGSRSIKAVIIERSFRGYEVKGTREVPVLQDGSSAPSSEAIDDATTRLLEEFDPDQVGYAVGWPGEKASVWFLQVPFTDQKRIDQTLPFEVENFVPFDLETMVLDYQVVRSNAGKSRILAALAHQHHVKATLQALSTIKVDPRALWLDSYAISLAPPISEPADQIVAIVDIGHTRTLITVRSGSQPDFVRTIPSGGLAITQALMQAFEVDFAAAEYMKHTLEPPPAPAKASVLAPVEVMNETETPSEEDAFLNDTDEQTRRLPREEEVTPTFAIPPTPADQPDADEDREEDSFINLLSEITEPGRELAAISAEPTRPLPSPDEIQVIVEEAQNSLIGEIRNALIAYEGTEHKEIGAMVLVGGGARLKGIEARMSEELGLSVGTVVRLGPDQTELNMGQNVPRFALAFALALLGVTDGKGGQIDFRQGEFSYQKRYEAVKIYLMAGFAIAALALLALTGHFVNQARTLSADAAALDSHIVDALVQGFPEVPSDGKDVDHTLAVILEEFAKLKEKGQILGVGSTVRPGLDYLKEFSSKIPARGEITLDVEDYHYEGQALKIRGTIDSFEAVDRMEKDLQESQFVQEIKSDVSTKGDKKSFNMTVTLKGPGDDTGS